MKQDNNYKWYIYMITMILIGLVLAFSIHIRKKRDAFNVLNKAIQITFNNDYNSQYPFCADSNNTFHYLEHISLSGCNDSSIYKIFFKGNQGKCYKIRRFTSFLYHASTNFPRSVIRLTSNINYYQADIMITASGKCVITLIIDKKDAHIISAVGLECILELYCRSLTH